MSNNHDWKQGQHDAQQNKGPANTNGWNSQAKESYDAGHAAQKGSQGGKK